MNHPPDSERAVSELFGAMVLIGVIVTGIAIAGVMMFSQPQPQKIPNLNALFSTNAQTVQVQHNGGDSFLKSELQIRLDGVDKTSSFKIDGTNTWSTWSVGQSLTYDIPTGSPVPLLIQIVYTGGGNSVLIASSGEGSTAGLSVPAPVVNSITPNTGNVGETVSITNLAGSYFFSGATVKLSRAGFSDISATNVIVVSSTQITCDFNLPALTQGSWDVVVTNPGGSTGTLTNGFTVQNPGAPTFASVTPTSGSTAGGTFVTITGTNFIGATSATFGGSVATNLSFVSDTTITATTPAHAAGAVDVVIATPNGSATGTNAYTYVAPPTFVSIIPTYGPVVGGTFVTITGTNLIGVTGVTFDGISATGVSILGDTTITATTPAHAAGAVNVVITTPNGTATGTNAYTYAGAPTFISIAPTSGTTLGGTPVTITGTNLIGATTSGIHNVSIGGTALTNMTVVSDTKIVGSTPAHAAGAVNVVITTPNGTATGTNAYTYVYVAPPPTFTSINPTYGSTFGVTAVTIVGTNLIGATGVTFGGTAATNLSVVSATTVTASTPAHAAGTVDVVITVTDVSPKKGPLLGGTIVTITGTGFTGATAVKFGSTNAASFTVNTATQITATSPAGSSAGPVDVTVTTPGGTSATSSADIFRYFVIQSFTTVGTTSWSVPSGVTTVEYLVVAGGGGGGRYGGGGGAGGFRTGTLTGLSGSQTVTVGGGGAGATSSTVRGSNGGNSVFATITATGGGGGGSSGAAGVYSGAAGGSGGGGTRSTGAGGAGNTPSVSPSQGNNGGAGARTSTYTGGGGGGAGAVGSAATASAAGNGGAGTASSISGSSVTYAGGGGGGCNSAWTAGTGGAGGGGAGGDGAVGSAGTANSGGGGGGSGAATRAGGAGGSGIVIIMYY